MTGSSDSLRPLRVSPARRLLACTAGAMLLAGPASLVPLDAAAQSPAASACPAAGIEAAAVASVDQRLEIHLKDGRVLRLAGFEPVRPTPDNPDFDTIARDVLTSVLARAIPGAIGFIPLSPVPDRWGRIPVFAFLSGQEKGAGQPSLAELLLTLGYGRFMPEPEARPCQADFLAAEAGARARRNGLWQDPYYAVIAASDTRAFAEKAATNIIVEGRVRDIDIRPRRSYLLFGPRGSGGFAVTILQRDVKIFEQAGFAVHALIGKRIRVRGLLDLRFGPQIAVSDLASIEVVSPSEGASSTGQPVEAKAADPDEKPQ
ncbi:hypothetical protein CWB41_04550 [Methylovirgula ligni]|uniref:Nuclease-like protein n=1 Tax=Methylovirgula ligni TaxID=569860 RepID=A0A3D9Z386_9HYPH|nr:hypothetical protein [Methylovirgula ligni]QAY95087.1 hypothetical protein CWB41_04550 [Methylovirgula ligni]REF89633.1 hypothetical protein DES32_0862 [Methylovirgula ligni]